MASKILIVTENIFELTEATKSALVFSNLIFFRKDIFTHMALLYLMLQHPCRFKVGVKHADIDLYDLSISVTEREDIKHLFEHILFYLQAIRSK